MYIVLSKSAMVLKKREEEENKGRLEGEGRRRREGGDALGRDTTFPWSRALTHRTRHRVIRGQEVPGVRPYVGWRPSWIRCPYLDLDFVTLLVLKRGPYY